MGLTGCGGSSAEAGARPYALTLSVGALTTPLTFASGNTQRLDELSALVAFSWQLTPALSLQGGLGAVLGGSLDGSEGNYRLSPGPLVSLGVGYTFVRGESGWTPFVAGALTVTRISQFA